MKVSVQIECSPEEARAFFGLPDLSPVHDAYVDKMKSMVTEGVQAADIDKMTRSWMPGVADSFEQWRQLMLSAMPKPQQ